MPTKRRIAQASCLAVATQVVHFPLHLRFGELVIGHIRQVRHHATPLSLTQLPTHLQVQGAMLRLRYPEGR